VGAEPTIPKARSIIKSPSFYYDVSAVSLVRVNQLHLLRRKGEKGELGSPETSAILGNVGLMESRIPSSSKRSANYLCTHLKKCMQFRGGVRTPMPMSKRPCYLLLAPHHPSHTFKLSASLIIVPFLLCSPPLPSFPSPEAIAAIAISPSRSLLISFPTLHPLNSAYSVYSAMRKC
jgi:hypothetical protein